MGAEGSWSNQLRNVVIVGGPSGAVVGVFVYATGTTPGNGNPPIAWISNSATDPYGNTLPANTIVTEDATTKILTAMSAGLIQIGRGTLASSLWGQIALNVSGVTGVDFKGIKTSVGDPAAAEFVLRSASQNGLGTGVPTMEMQSGTFIVSDSWHTMSGFSNSWVATGNTPRYRLMSDNMVQVDGAMDATSATAAAFFTLPAAYFPASPTKLYPAGANGGVIAGQAPFINVSSAGVMSTGGVTLPTAGAHVTITGRYPLD